MQLLPRWPANRWDLNPIEMVWAIMGARLAGRRFSDRQGLFAALREMWNALSMDTINALVLDFPRRVSLVLAVRGASISQLLSSHMAEPRAQDVWGGAILPFTAEEDAHTMAWARQHGRKCTRLLEDGEWAGPRTTLSLKHRYFVLEDMERNEMLARLSELAADMEGLADIATDLMSDSDEARIRAFLHLPAPHCFCSET
jgi:hypothetical protein